MYIKLGKLLPYFLISTDPNIFLSSTRFFSFSLIVYQEVIIKEVELKDHSNFHAISTLILK